ALALWAGPAVLGLLGLLAGLFPSVLGVRMLAPAGSIAAGGSMDVDLKLWHGVNEAFLLSMLTLGLGVLLVLLRGPWRRLTRPLQFLDRLGPEAAYHGGVNAMLGLARAQTRVLQHG